jgi:polysaccharide export outer membrane protein
MKRTTLIAVLTALAGPAAAQQPPISPEQVRTQLQQPGAAQSLRDRIQQSGLTPEQIRARLQSSGYASNLLDQFLEQGAVGDSTPPGADQLAAITALGLAPTASTKPVVGTPEGAPGTGRPAVLQRSRYFGVDVFRRSTTQFLPLFTGPVPPEYRLGPGDVPVLILTGDVERAQPLPITREGFVLIPQVGQVYLANQTLDQAKQILFDRLRRVYSSLGRGPDAGTRMDLSVSNVRAVTVFTVGEVAQPGAYQISALGSALTALYAAGGITDQGDLRRVQVRRRSGSVVILDAYAYLLRGDTRNDVRLEDGDVIFVPGKSRRVVVAGAVGREAIYDVDSTETLTQVISNAGGLNPEANSARITIHRIIPAAERVAGGPERRVVTVPLTAVAGQTAPVVPGVPVVDGDSITVDAIGGESNGFVTVRGNVRLTGPVGFSAGLTLSQLVAQAGGLDALTFAGRAHIERLDPVDSTRSIIAVPLPAAGDAAWPNDPQLREFDVVTIYGRGDMREPMTVRVSGLVVDPGERPYREGMTLRDLLLQANGFRSGAWLDTVEIARLPQDRGRGQLAQIIRVPIDSTYIFDRDSSGRAFSPRGIGFRAGGAAEFLIEPFDNVTVFRQPGFELQQRIVITGQVRFPGTYALTERRERISDLIRRAGGLTEQAFADGVRFYRRQGDVGRIDVDLPRALRRPGDRNDLLLQTADSIDVPVFQPSVRVFGAVNSPGSVLWVNGRDIDYYIGAAGGLAANADNGAASARLANGRVETRGKGFLFFGGSAPKPGPGGEVFVPVEPERPYQDRTALYAALASIIASTATILVSLTR